MTAAEGHVGCYRPACTLTIGPGTAVAVYCDGTFQRTGVVTGHHRGSYVVQEPSGVTVHYLPRDVRAQ